MTEVISFETWEKDGITIINVSGRMDATTSREIESEINRLIDSGIRKVVFNGKELIYISSSGLRVILAGMKRLRQDGGEMALASLQAAPLEVIRMTGFDRIFKIFDSTEVAISSIS
ncbi:MAG TPA: STAS domain-containing protein [Methanospirillum sp.]|nr:STAS domain-containing protein [Methanospirillum sp.]